MSIIRNHVVGECAANYQRNGLGVQMRNYKTTKHTCSSFVCALRNVFLNGTQKDTGILIVVPINYRKSFLLNPFNSRSKILIILVGTG